MVLIFGPRFRPLEQSLNSHKSPQGGVGEVVWTSYELKKTIVTPIFTEFATLDREDRAKCFDRNSDSG